VNHQIFERTLHCLEFQAVCLFEYQYSTSKQSALYGHLWFGLERLFFETPFEMNIYLSATLMFLPLTELVYFIVDATV
jgi:hypothetical protein